MIVGWVAVFAVFTGLFIVMGVLEGLAQGDFAVLVMCWLAAAMMVGIGVLVVSESL